MWAVLCTSSSPCSTNSSSSSRRPPWRDDMLFLKGGEGRREVRGEREGGEEVCGAVLLRVERYLGLCC